MKKLLGKRSLFLVALLVSLCRPAMAQQVPQSGSTYYVQNVGTGLYLKYGGVWGTHVMEGRAAHPIYVKSNTGANAGTYSLSSLMGSLNSLNLYMDTDMSTSKWTLQKVEGSDNEYFLVGYGGRVLASQGNANGVVDLKILDQTDRRHKWVFKTADDILNEAKQTGDDAPSQTNPVDLTPLIKASAFDLADGEENTLTADEDHYNDAWANYAAYAEFNWHSMVRGEWNNPATYSSIGILKREETDDGSLQYYYNQASNGSYGAARGFTVSQSLKGLPAGYYYFSFSGFYNYYKEIIEQEESHNYDNGTENINCGTISKMERTPMTMDVKVRVSGGGEYTLDAYRGIDVNYNLIDGKPTIVENDENYAFAYNIGTLDAPQIVRAGELAATELKTNELNYRKGGRIYYDGNSDFTISIVYPETEKGYRYHSSFGWSSGERDQKIARYPSWVCMDNFTLLYYGTEQPTVTPNMADYYNKLLSEYISELRETVTNQYPNGVTIFNNGVAGVETDMNDKKIDTEPEYIEALEAIDKAYQDAINAHMASLGKEYDMTHMIFNNSFEIDDNFDYMPDGWTKVLSYGGGDNDWGTRDNQNQFETQFADGYRVFNSWAGDANTNTAFVEQKLATLPVGLYELRASLTSHPGNMVYIKASDLDANDNKRNSYNSGIRAEDNGVFQEVSLYFLVEPTNSGANTGKIIIGAIGGNSGATGKFDYYWPNGGCYFKADNFRLRFISNLANGHLKLALHEAESAVLDVYGKAMLERSIASYKARFDNRSIQTETEGKAAAKEVYDILQDASKAQKLIGTNMTYAVYNPSFDWDNNGVFPMGWTCNTGEDTGARAQDNGTYSVVGTVGRFLFNTFKNGNASALTQTITNLCPGDYKVRAMVTSDGGNKIKLTANNVTKEVEITSNATLGFFPEVQCTVDEGGVLNLKVEGTNGKWFKCDDFQLTMIEPDKLVLEESADVIADIKGVQYPGVQVNRSIKVGTNWSSLVLPFDMSIPKGWEVKKFVGGTVRQVAGEDNITLHFDNATSIQAGVPYMVRTNEAKENISVTNVSVNTTLAKNCCETECNTYDVEFVGVYTKGKIPASKEGEEYFFISGNNFYRSVTGTDNIKGFRAYFKVNTKNAGALALRSLSMRIGDETVIESAPSEDEVYVVGIYDVNGVRLECMKPGINILRMNNGSTKKVMVK